MPKFTGATGAMDKKKITVVGAGNVGASLAQKLLEKGLGEVVIIDTLAGLAQGKALDLLQSAAIENYPHPICGTTNYEVASASDVVIITAGISRKPGMSRDALLAANERIVADVTKQIATYSPQAIIIVVTNPLDAMCQVALNTSGFPKNRILGMAGLLDTARYRTFLAQAIGVAPIDIQAMVLGGHGDTMVPLLRYTTISGIPIGEFIDAAELEGIITRTRNGGAEIVSLLQTGSAFYAPAAACAQMTEAIIRNRRMIIPCAAYLEGEYGISGIFMGVPIQLGALGVEKIIELPLDAQEQEMLAASAHAVRELVAMLKGSAADE